MGASTPRRCGQPPRAAGTGPSDNPAVERLGADHWRIVVELHSRAESVELVLLEAANAIDVAVMGAAALAPLTRQGRVGRDAVHRALEL